MTELPLPPSDPPGAGDAEIARRIIDLARAARRVLVLAHDNPDPDALASAFGLQALLRAGAGREAEIAFGGRVGRAENQAMIRLLGIQARPVEELNLESVDLVILVDTQPNQGNNSLPEETAPTVVIDHHPANPSLARNFIPVLDLREDYGATSTIVARYFLATGLPLDSAVATALFYGIETDTQHLARTADGVDREAFIALFPLIDHAVFAGMEKPRLPKIYFSMFQQAVEDAFIFGDVIYSHLGEVKTPEIVGEIADFLMRLQEMRWSVVSGVQGRALHVSVRAADPALDANKVIREVIGPRGQAGGHSYMAGGRIILLEGMEPAAVDELVQVVRDDFLKVLAQDQVKGVRLVY